MQGTMQLGYPAAAILPIGVVLLACTILYVVPATEIFGAVLLTGYLGGAVASNVRIGIPLFSHTLFPVYFAVASVGRAAVARSAAPQNFSGTSI